MARLFTSGFEQNTTTTNVDFDTYNTGTGMSMVSSGQRSGNYAMMITTPTATTHARYGFDSSEYLGIIYYRIYINLSAYPTGGSNVLLTVGDTSSNQVAGIQVTTAGALQIVNLANTPLGSNSSILTLGQWYCVEMSVDTTTLASSLIVGRLDHTTFASATVSITGGQARFIVGAASDTALIVYFDDCAVNDNTLTYQNTWCGPGQVISQQPNGAGDNSTWNTQHGGTAGTANNYTRVNAVTPNAGTTYNGCLTANDIDDYTLGASGIPNNATINCVQPNVNYAGAASSANASFKLRYKSATGGTVISSANITPTATSYNTNGFSVPRKNQVTAYTNTTTGKPLTVADIDAAQIGLNLTTNDTNEDLVTAVWTNVDYTLEDPNTIVHVNNVGSASDNSTSSFTITPVQASIAGNTIIVPVSFYRSSGAYPTCAVTDSKGNSYTNIYTFVGSATTGPSLIIAMANNTIALTTSDTITSTFTGNAPFAVAIADEWSGLSNTLDGSIISASGGSSTAVSFGPLTTTNATDLVLVVVSSFGNLGATTWSAPWANNEFKTTAPTISMAWMLPVESDSFSGKATLGTAEYWNYALLALQAKYSVIGNKENINQSVNRSSTY